MPDDPAFVAAIPIKLPEIMPCVRIRQMSPFGNMHVKISIDPRAGVEREVFAQLGRGGDIANGDLEAICRMVSVFLRCNGTLEFVVSQLSGIGSNLSIPSRDGQVLSLPDGLAKAIQRYLNIKKNFGLEDLLLGRADMNELYEKEKITQSRSPVPDKNDKFKVKCPECPGFLRFMEGCVKCESCGYSQC